MDIGSLRGIWLYLGLVLGVLYGNREGNWGGLGFWIFLMRVDYLLFCGCEDVGAIFWVDVVIGIYHQVNK
jgi:hypothetical protein